MDIRQLTYFVAVAEEGHFGRAAERVHIAQPPLSQQIKKLEDELGVRLFDRTSRRVALTRAGEVLYERAVDILSRMHAAEEQLRAMAEGRRGRLSVGFVGPAMESRLPEAVRAYREARPDVTLTLKQLSTMQQLELVAEGQLDVGFVRLFDEQPALMERRLFLQEEYVLAVPQAHPLAQDAGPVQLAALAGESWIVFPRESGPKLYDAIMDACRQEGFTPRIVQETLGKQTTAALVAAGMGISLLPRGTTLSRPGLVTREIEGPLPLMEIWAVWRTGNDAATVHEFLDAVGAEAGWV
ncbi:LysR family transcriptional regulator [Oceanidesulfovibrio indonesiensis]|uniref:LysR family transcriptional regulator n=1 Tax=Oceanidesulfovibrio indonesiensis TaxID=54767 RepID=A0A7M3MEM2_9BACT|nr:LysR family transcriptional regulator [Oceanidesulfovibrio indonesiensis]TVM17334.1 LysR family transcriptional regulator [Oceanidesulfovibrio indonesiensis]